jgi:hypothetical protein
MATKQKKSKRPSASAALGDRPGVHRGGLRLSHELNADALLIASHLGLSVAAYWRLALAKQIARDKKELKL